MVIVEVAPFELLLADELLRLGTVARQVGHELLIVEPDRHDLIGGDAAGGWVELSVSLVGAVGELARLSNGEAAEVGRIDQVGRRAEGVVQRLNHHSARRAVGVAPDVDAAAVEHAPLVARGRLVVHIPLALILEEVVDEGGHTKLEVNVREPLVAESVLVHGGDEGTVEERLSGLGEPMELAVQTVLLQQEVVLAVDPLGQEAQVPLVGLRQGADAVAVERADALEEGRELLVALGVAEVEVLDAVLIALLEDDALLVQILIVLVQRVADEGGEEAALRANLKLAEGGGCEELVGPASGTALVGDEVPDFGPRHAAMLHDPLVQIEVAVTALHVLLHGVDVGGECGEPTEDHGDLLRVRWPLQLIDWHRWQLLVERLGHDLHDAPVLRAGVGHDVHRRAILGARDEAHRIGRVEMLELLVDRLLDLEVVAGEDGLHLADGLEDESKGVDVSEIVHGPPRQVEHRRRQRGESVLIGCRVVAQRLRLDAGEREPLRLANDGGEREVPREQELYQHLDLLQRHEAWIEAAHEGERQELFDGVDEVGAVSLEAGQIVDSVANLQVGLQARGRDGALRQLSGSLAKCGAPALGWAHDAVGAHQQVDLLVGGQGAGLRGRTALRGVERRAVLARGRVCGKDAGGWLAGWRRGVGQRQT